MADNAYNDRALTKADDAALPKPQIEIIVDGTSIFKPGMMTYFIDDYEKEEEANAKVVGTYCTCDTVLSTITVCTCERVSTCSCHAFKPGCTCQNLNTGNIGGGTVCSCQRVSCGSPCACIPVYL